MLKKDVIKEIEKKLGYTFEDEALLKQAFTRASYRMEHPDARDNVVLEFFGKMVLSHIVSDVLLDRYTFRDDSGLVSYMQEDAFMNMHYNCTVSSYLAEKMRAMNLHPHIVLIGEDPAAIDVLTDLFESIVAAIYLDSNKDIMLVKAIAMRMLGI